MSKTQNDCLIILCSWSLKLCLAECRDKRVTLDYSKYGIIVIGFIAQST